MINERIIISLFPLLEIRLCDNINILKIDISIIYIYINGRNINIDCVYLASLIFSLGTVITHANIDRLDKVLL